MVTQTKSQRFANPRTPMMDGCAVFLVDQVTIAANPTANDTADFLLPRGIQLALLRFSVPDMDSSTGITGKIGWYPVSGTTATQNGVAATAADLSAFRADAALGQAAAVIDCDIALPMVFEEDVYIRIHWTVTASGTFTAGTIYCTMGGAYLGVK